MKVLGFLLFFSFPLFLFSQETNKASVVSTNAPPEHLEQVQIDLGNGFLSREFYDLALAEYQKYLEWFPNGMFVEEAMFRVADSLRGLNRPDAAREQYQKVQAAFPKGVFYAKASFRLGEMDWNAGNFEKALHRFRESAEKAESPETRLTAQFYQARTLIQLNRNQEAVPVLRELAKIEKQNPYRAFALLELARVFEANQEDEARLLYAKVLEMEASPMLRAEGGLKAGILEMKAKRWEQAVSLFEKVRSLQIPQEWIRIANLNLVRAAYQGDQYELVVRTLSNSKNPFPENSMAEMDLLHAHALRSLRKYKEAVQRYDIFLKNYPSDLSRESAFYERLICLFAIESKTIEAEAEMFLKTYPESAGRPKILYLLAARAFQRKDFAKAAEIYTALPIRKLDPRLEPEILFQYGLSLAQTRQYEKAASILDEFLLRFPKHEWIPNALFQRGLVAEEMARLQDAAQLFRDLTTKYPKAPERQEALYRLALLEGELKRYESMRKAFQQLNQDYPQNAFKQDAVYWVGWSLFEEKKYAESLPYLEKARKEKPSAYGKEVTSRMILAHYHLRQRFPLWKEIQALPKDWPPIAPEMYDWLARQSLEAKDFASAEQQFQRLINHPQAASWRQSARWGLAESLMAQAKWQHAIEVLEAYQEDYRSPAEIVATKLKLVQAYKALQNYTRAQEIAEDVLRLQPEGKNNAEARYALGEIMSQQKQHSEAAKYFLSVAVLYEDPDLTPRSLTRAIQSFEAAGETNQVLRLQQELKTKYPDFK